MPDSEDLQLYSVITAKKQSEPPGSNKKTSYLLILIFSIAVIAGLFFLFKFTANFLTESERVPEKIRIEKIGSYDLRLIKSYLAKKTKSDIIINKAKKDCHEISQTEPEEFFLASYDFLKGLKGEMLNKIGIKADDTEGLILASEEVPGTNVCFLAWIIDSEGRGIAGYKKRSGEVVIFNSVYSRQKLNEVLTNIGK